MQLYRSGLTLQCIQLMKEMGISVRRFGEVFKTSTLAKCLAFERVGGVMLISYLDLVKNE